MKKKRAPKPGRCRKCGCTEDNACAGYFGLGCSWVDKTRTRCSSCFPFPVPRRRSTAQRVTPRPYESHA